MQDTRTLDALDRALLDRVRMSYLDAEVLRFEINEAAARNDADDADPTVVANVAAQLAAKESLSSRATELHSTLIVPFLGSAETEQGAWLLGMLCLRDDRADGAFDPDDPDDGAVPEWFWWGISCSRRSGSEAQALAQDLTQFAAHAPGLEARWKAVVGVTGPPSQSAWSAHRGRGLSQLPTASALVTTPSSPSRLMTQGATCTDWAHLPEPASTRKSSSGTAVRISVVESWRPDRAPVTRARTRSSQLAGSSPRAATVVSMRRRSASPTRG